MKKLKILSLIGGISKDSINKKLYFALNEIAKNEAHFQIADVARFPFFSQDLEMDPPDVITEFKEQIRECHAVLFVTPEYNRSIPGVLKNAIDWGSRPYGQNLWDKLPAGIIGASIGNIGTFGAQHHLRQILSYLNLNVMNQPEFYLNASKAFDGTGKLISKDIENLILNYWSAYKEWIQFYTKNQKEMNVPIFNDKGVKENPQIHH
jgi:chromate reductase